MRIELSPANTKLPAQLAEFGYSPSRAGQVSVFTGRKFEQYDILIIDLPRRFCRRHKLRR
jgi:hypothetical protein